MKIRGRIKRKSIDVRKGVFLLPNICTTASLFLGFYSIIQSLSQNYVVAAWAIILAGVFDTFDGRIARMARAESQFGIEYDSLVDLISFGIAPVVLIYMWSLIGLGKWGLLATFLYLACGTMRLARFNVQHKNIEQIHFQGLPIPVAAAVATSGILCYNQYFPNLSLKLWITAGATMFLAFLMISTIKYRSLKHWNFRHRLSLFALTLVAVAVFIVAVKPAMAIFSGMSLYIIFGLLELIFNLIFRRKSRKKDQNIHQISEPQKTAQGE